MAAQIRAQLKRAILSSLFNQAGSATLISILQGYQNALVIGVKGGRVIEATSEAGHSVKFRTPNITEHFRPEDTAELSQQFLEVYADAVTALQGTGIPSPTDAQIFAQMNADDRLQSITTTRTDFSVLRWPNRAFLLPFALMLSILPAVT